MKQIKATDNLSEILIPMVRKAKEDDHDFKIGMKVATRAIESE